MNIQTIVNESKRGCGFRKAGGLYLVGGGETVPCGKLPIPLTVCPTCGQGIKPARGWTWVNGKKLAELVADIECNQPHCGTCSINNPPEKVGLIWVGEKFYKTTDKFLNEVAEKGISRRITHIPHDFKLDETWVWLAHRKAIECNVCCGTGHWHSYTTTTEGSEKLENYTICENCEGIGYFAGVFYAYKPERIEYAVKGDETEKELEGMEKRGISLIKLVRTTDDNGNNMLFEKEAAM